MAYLRKYPRRACDTCGKDVAYYPDHPARKEVYHKCESVTGMSILAYTKRFHGPPYSWEDNVSIQNDNVNNVRVRIIIEGFRTTLEVPLFEARKIYAELGKILTALKGIE